MGARLVGVAHDDEQRGGPTIVHRHGLVAAFHLHRAPTAVCLAGEARTLVSSRVRAAQLRHLITPLRADTYLVLAPPPRREDSAEGWTSSMLRIEEQMSPVSVVLARDDQMESALANLDLPSSERQRVEECINAQPLPRRRVDRGDQDWRAYFQLGPCAPQLSLALRHRACLALIERGEHERQRQYEWVIRARPDLAVPCLLSESVAFRAGEVRYFMDWIAFMPRAAADDVLREVITRHRTAPRVTTAPPSLDQAALPPIALRCPWLAVGT